MLRTRLLWFTAGFSLTGAAIGQFLWKDLWSDRYALSADAKQNLMPLKQECRILSQTSGRLKVRYCLKLKCYNKVPVCLCFPKLYVM